jgi:hypothetical protein
MLASGGCLGEVGEVLMKLLAFETLDHSIREEPFVTLLYIRESDPPSPHRT